MTDATIRRLAWLAAGLSTGLAVTGLAVGLASHSPVLGGYGLATAVMGATFPLCGAVILTQRPTNRIGWLFVFIGFWQALEPLSGVYAILALRSHPHAPGLAGFMGWISEWAWAPGIATALTFLFLLYPDGRLPSPRWRPVAWLAAIAIVVLTVPLAASTWGLPPSDLVGQRGPTQGIALLVYSISQFSLIAALPIVFACVGSLFMRRRHATGDLRQQIRWFAYGAVIVVAGIVGDSVVSGGSWVSVLFVPALPIAAGIAILKYRLYDIDVVISRTLVYGALAALISAVYVGIAVGIGALAGGGGKPNLGLSILATAIVAVGFQPVRERLQHVVNRLVYGKRATPYEVLSAFAERVAEGYAVEEVLPRMAQVLAEGTGAQRADVWVRSGDALQARAQWPPDAPPREPVAIDGTPPHTVGDDRMVAVRHQDQLLGALSVTKRHGEALTPVEESLLTDLANQAGLVIRNVGLTADLSARLEELRASRQRLVSAQDEERRHLERNLHDGAQQHLVALKVKLGMTQVLLERDPTRARTTLTELKTDADEALETLRDLARGIYPPLLAEKGLVAALESQARKATVAVTIEALGVERYSQNIEAAVYFCVLEALQNVQKYARARSATVSLAASHDDLRFTVTDDGCGFDAAATRRGSGLVNMEDRLDALGGRLEVQSSAGAGTRLSGSVPVAAHAEALAV